MKQKHGTVLMYSIFNFIFFSCGQSAKNSCVQHEFVKGKSDDEEAPQDEQGDKKASLKQVLENFERKNVYVAAEQGDLSYIEAEVKKNPSWLKVPGPNKQTILHLAAKHGHLDILKFCLKNQADIKAKDINDNTFLFVAVANKQKEVLEFFLKSSELEASIGLSNKEGQNLFHLALENNFLEGLELLCKTYGDHGIINSDDKKDKTVLCYAVEKGNKEAVEILCKHSKVISLIHGREFLIFKAINSKNVDIVKLLSEKFFKAPGATKKALYNQSTTVVCSNGVNKEFFLLDFIISYGNADILKYFLETYPDDDALNKALKHTGEDYPLFRAVANSGSVDLINYLLSFPEIKIDYCFENRTALLFAAGRGQKDIFIYILSRLLMSHSKDFNLNYHLYLSLNYAANVGHLDIFKAVFDNQDTKLLRLVKKNIGNIPGYIKMAISNGHQHIVDYLLDRFQNHENILNPSVKDNRNYWAVVNEKKASDDISYSLLRHGVPVDKNQVSLLLPIAAKKGDFNLVCSLLQQGGDVYSVDDEKNNTPLHYAVQFENVEAVTRLLEEHVDLLNRGNKEKKTAISIAAEKGNKELFDLLLSKGADIKAKDKDDMSLLHYAAIGGNMEIFSDLVSKKFDINEKDKQERTPLHLAARYGNKDIVAYLLDKKVTDMPDADGMTAVGYVCKNLGPEDKIEGKCEILQIFKDHGIKFNNIDRNGETLIHYAAQFGLLPVVNFLIENLPDANGNVMIDKKENLLDAHWDEMLDKKKTLTIAEFIRLDTAYLSAYDLAIQGNHNDVVAVLQKYQETNFLLLDILNYAVEMGDLEIVKYCLDLGIDVNTAIPGAVGNLVWIAAVKQHPNIVSFLLEQGGDIDQLSITQLTALGQVAKQGDLEMMELLVAKGADIAKIKDINLSLWVAAYCQKWELVKSLIVDKKANVDFVHAQLSILSCAVRAENLEIIKFLVEKGGAKTDVSVDGQHILCFAADEGCWDIVEYLLKHGLTFENFKTRNSLKFLAYVITGDTDAVKQMECFVNILDKKTGRTALHFAVIQGSEEMVETLLSFKNIERNVKDKDGKTPGDYAKDRSNEKIKKLLGVNV